MNMMNNDPYFINLMNMKMQLTSIDTQYNSMITQVQNLGLIPNINMQIYNIAFQILNFGIQMLNLGKQTNDNTNMNNYKEQINDIIKQLTNFTDNNINQNNIILNSPNLNENQKNCFNDDFKKDISHLKNEIKMLREEQQKNNAEIISILSKDKFDDSTIISRNEYDMISDWISPNKKIEVKLLYRASRDGDKAEDFHNKCDNKGSTFCIFHLDNGYIIGGYTSISWKNEGGGKKDPNAFVCSITNKEKYELKNKNGKAVFHCKYGGPKFNDGKDGWSDIGIKDNCLKIKDGIVVLSKIYNSSIKKLVGLESDSYLQLKLKDYEVYQIL